VSISSGIALVLGGAAASLAALAIAAGADAASRRDTRVLLVNDTDHALTRLYASPVGDSYYNGNALFDRTLAPGQSLLMDFDFGARRCLIDVKAGFDDDSYRVKHGFNVCTQATLTFSGD
jgi:hypothetical protein